jgi:hypothetical protein
MQRPIGYLKGFTTRKGATPEMSSIPFDSYNNDNTANIEKVSKVVDSGKEEARRSRRNDKGKAIHEGGVDKEYVRKLEKELEELRNQKEATIGQQKKCSIDDGGPSLNNSILGRGP